jgi:hypothetical protein
LQYYRLQRVSSGPIELKVGEPEGVYSPTDVGTGKAKEEKAPLSEIIQVLNERFGTTFTDEDRLFFDQIKARATSNSQVIQTAMANPLDKFKLGIRKVIEDMMIQRMAENDQDRDSLHGRRRFRSFLSTPFRKSTFQARISPFFSLCSRLVDFHLELTRGFHLKLTHPVEGWASTFSTCSPLGRPDSNASSAATTSSVGYSLNRMSGRGGQDQVHPARGNARGGTACARPALGHRGANGATS